MDDNGGLNMNQMILGRIYAKKMIRFLRHRQELNHKRKLENEAVQKNKLQRALQRRQVEVFERSENSEQLQRLPSNATDRSKGKNSSLEPLSAMTNEMKENIKGFLKTGHRFCIRNKSFRKLKSTV